MRKLLIGVLLVMCCILAITGVAYAVQAGAKDDFSDDFFWRIIAGGCSLLMVIIAYQIRQRDILMDKMAAIIYGHEEKEGLLTRITVIENNIDRCEGCNPHHMREGDSYPHVHHRESD